MLSTTARIALRAAGTPPTPATTAFLLCDIQERFRSFIWNYPHVINTASKMVAASKLLNIPVVVTEQNPKALGSTVKELDISNAAVVAAKTKFSMMVPEVEGFIKEKKIKSVVLFGIESHVCVLQTALDFLAKDYHVIVLADGVSSMNRHEAKISLTGLGRAGATITSSESILFELMGDSNHPQFRAVSGLVKEYKDKTTGALDALGANL
ncbi:Isochorismatase domain-containing protein 1 [Borealophlyctis nickersoniae]|nr:Isochorismatase domain-containing protein 1 [Borealophlyctis nickersoniae]